MLSLRTPEQRVPEKHPLRAIKKMADEALDALSSKFDEMYSPVGRSSIPPEQLLKGSLLQALYSIRSERGPATPCPAQPDRRLSNASPGSGGSFVPFFFLLLTTLTKGAGFNLPGLGD